jgi:anaerobic nitric oxide reductase transcription regulator
LLGLDVAARPDGQPETAGNAPLPATAGGTPLSLKNAMEACQRQTIRAALDRTQQNWAEAARLLKLDASNLHKLARRLGIK